MAGTNANVVIAPIPPDDLLGKYADSAAGPGIYIDYTVRCRYLSCKRRYMLGITSPNGFQGQSAAFVQLAAPTLLWVADWTALRAVLQPEPPDSDPRDPNWILLDENYEPAQLAVYDDGVSPAYRISGTYVYGCKLPETQVVRNVSYPRPAWLDDAFDRTIPISALIQGIIKVQANAGPGAIGLGP